MRTRLLLCCIVGWVALGGTQDELDETETYYQLQILPGIDTLGWGLNLRQSADFETALKVPLFSFDYERERNTYSYPLYPQQLFRYPDDVWIRTASRVETETTQSTNSSEERTKLEIDFGLSGRFSTGNEGMFEGDLELNFERKELDTGLYLKATNKIYNGLWQLVIGNNQTIDRRIQRAMDNLALVEPGNELEFIKFVDYYGTHYVDSILVGGKLEMNTMIDRSEYNETNDLEVLANAEFTNLFGISKAQLELDLNFESNLREFNTRNRFRLATKGGNYSVANFFSGNTDPKATFEEWLSDLVRNAVPVKLRALEISWLFKDATLRRYVSNAVRMFLNGGDALDPITLDFQSGGGIQFQSGGGQDFESGGGQNFL